MNIEIELDTQIYKYLLELAAKNKISFNVLVERCFLDLIAENIPKPKN